MTPNEQLVLDDLLELIPIPGPPGSECLVAAPLRRKLVTMGIPEGSITTDNAQDQSEYEGDTGNLIVTLDGHGCGDRGVRPYLLGDLRLVVEVGVVEVVTGRLKIGNLPCGS